MVSADPPKDETPPSPAEVREAVRKLKGGRSAEICKFSADLLKAGGEAMILGLHAVLPVLWQSGIPCLKKKGLVVLVWKGEEDRQACNNHHCISLFSVLRKLFAHLLLYAVNLISSVTILET